MFARRRKKAIVIAIAIIVLWFGLKIILDPPLMVINVISNLVCPRAISYFETNEPLVALTIDDSPDDNHSLPHTTLSILDTLGIYNAKATFFIITNKAETYPQVLTAIVEQGHELGNHLTNDEPSIKLGDRFETEFIKADGFLRPFAPINWFRPGHGRCNAKITKIARKYNYRITIGSVWSYDTFNLPWQFSSWYISKNIRPGSIIILHDSDSKSDRRGKNTIKTLNKIIPQLQKRGYSFVTLSELEKQSQQ